MEVYGGVLPQKHGSPISPGNAFAGPLLAGTIPKSSSLALGGQPAPAAGLGGTVGLANLGYVKMAQSAVVGQVAAPGVASPIVIPAQSQILAITMMTTTLFTANVSIGITGGTGSDLVAATAIAALGQLALSAGAAPATIALWDNVGNADVQITAVGVTAGAGVGTLTVEYLQGINNAS